MGIDPREILYDGVGIEDVEGDVLSKRTISRMLRWLPNRYKENWQETLRFYLSSDHWDVIVSWLALRHTVTTDGIVLPEERQPLRIYGIPVRSMPDFPDDRILLTTRENWENGLDQQEAVVVAVNITLPPPEKMAEIRAVAREYAAYRWVWFDKNLPRE